MYRGKGLLYFFVTLSNHHCMTYLSHLAAIQGHASLNIYAALDWRACCVKLHQTEGCRLMKKQVLLSIWQLCLKWPIIQCCAVKYLHQSLGTEDNFHVYLLPTGRALSVPMLKCWQYWSKWRRQIKVFASCWCLDPICSEVSAVKWSTICISGLSLSLGIYLHLISLITLSPLFLFWP